MRFEVFYFSLCQKCFALTKMFSLKSTSVKMEIELAWTNWCVLREWLVLGRSAGGSHFPSVIFHFPPLLHVLFVHTQEILTTLLRWGCAGRYWRLMPEPSQAPPVSFPPILCSKHESYISSEASSFTAENKSYGEFITFMMGKKKKKGL